MSSPISPAVSVQRNSKNYEERSRKLGSSGPICFSERFEVPSVTRAGELVRAGRIGRVIQTIGLGPHREGDRVHLAGGAGRPDWFYDHTLNGGIITDIASHQIDQFLWFTGATTAEVVASTVANYTHETFAADAGLRRGAAAQQ